MIVTTRRRRWTLVLASAVAAVTLATVFAGTPTSAASLSESRPNTFDGTIAMKAVQNHVADVSARSAAALPGSGNSPQINPLFRIVSRYSFDNKACVDAFSSYGGVNGNPVGLFQCTGGRTQSWHWGDTGDTGTQLVNDFSGRCLTDLQGAVGTRYIIWDCLANDSDQQFAQVAVIGGGTYIAFRNDPFGDNDILLTAWPDPCYCNGMPVGSKRYIAGNSLQQWDIEPS